MKLGSRYEDRNNKHMEGISDVRQSEQLCINDRTVGEKKVLTGLKGIFMIIYYNDCCEIAAVLSMLTLRGTYSIS